MKRIHLLFCILCLMGLYSCSVDELGKGDNTKYDTDTYQSELRQMKSDSVTFVLNPDVKVFSEAQLKNLVELQDDSTLVFSSDLPAEYLPQPGDVYIYSMGTGTDCEALRYGFMRRIKSVQRSTRAGKLEGEVYVLGTSFASLNDVFSFVKAELSTLGSQRTELPIDITPIKSDDYSLQFGNDASNISYKGKIEVKVEGGVSINSEEQTFLLTVIPQMTLNGTLSASLQVPIGFDQTKKHLVHVPAISIPIVVGSVIIPSSIGLNVYSYATAEAALTGTTSINTTIAPVIWTLGMKSGKRFHEIKNKEGVRNPLGADMSVDITHTLSFKAGLGLRYMFGYNICNFPVYDSDVVYLDMWAGLTSEFELDFSEESEFPSYMRDTPIKMMVSAEACAQLKYDFFNGVELVIPIVKRTGRWHICDFYLWPDFASTRHTVHDNDVTLYTRMDRNLLCPVKLGYTVTDEAGTELGQYMDNDRIYWINALYDNPLSEIIYNLEEGKTYYAYPTVSIFGKTFAPRDYKYHPFSLADQEPPFYGVWELIHVKGLESGEAYEGDVTPDAVKIEFTLREDNTFYYYAWAKGEDGDADELIEDSGTWTYDNWTITLTYDNGLYKSIIQVLEWTPERLVTKQTDEEYYEIRTFRLKDEATD